MSIYPSCSSIESRLSRLRCARYSRKGLIRIPFNRNERTLELNSSRRQTPERAPLFPKPIDEAVFYFVMFIWILPCSLLEHILIVRDDQGNTKTSADQGLPCSYTRPSLRTRCATLAVICARCLDNTR